MTILAMTVMIAMLGLAFDLGHLFIVRTELQTFADASALAAASQLDGTQSGVQTANATATAGPLGSTRPNGYDFDANTISNVTTGFATSFSGTYDPYATAAGGATNSYRFISVAATATVPVYFMPVVNLMTEGSISSQMTLTATATGGQQPSSSMSNGGLIPFSPSAHNAADTKNFGLIPGNSYSLKWGNGNTTNCAGDSGFNPGNAPSAHGFVDLGQGNGNSALRNVIVWGGYPNSNSTPSSVTDGTVLYQVPGNRGSSIFSSTAERSNQDPDQTSVTWAQYKAAGTGNGRRVVTAAIHDPALNSGNGANFHMTVIGFGNFLLDIGSSISGSSGPLCATYIGPGSVSGGASGGADGTKIYAVTLYK